MHNMMETRLSHLVEEPSAMEGESDCVAMMDSSTPTHSQPTSQTSSPDMPLPSPTFAQHPQSRMQTVSSLPSSPTVADSVEFGSTKRPLTEVKEEPLEKDEDFEMLSAPSSHGYSFEAARQESTPPPPEMKWNLDDPEVIQSIESQYPGEYAGLSSPKRPRADNNSPFSSFANKVSSRMPSLSRKLRPQRASPNPTAPLSRDPSLSRAESSRAPSLASVQMEAQRSFSNAYPPTPAASTKHDSLHESHISFVESQRKASSHYEQGEEGSWEDQAKPTTPLLPPLMTERRSQQPDAPTSIQSPLESPSVAVSAAPSALNSPMPTPVVGCLPSPPLSARPSIASFRRQPQQLSHHPSQSHFGPTSPVDLIPSSEIPPILIADPPTQTPDKWSDALGHANFTIYPEPYLPKDGAAFAHLQEDYDIARASFEQHLDRVADTFGPTSKMFQLTEEKWQETERIWKGNLEICAGMARQVKTTTVIAAPVNKGTEHVSAGPARSSASPQDIQPLRCRSRTQPSSPSTPPVVANLIRRDTSASASIVHSNSGSPLASTGASPLASLGNGPPPPIPPRAPSRQSSQALSRSASASKPASASPLLKRGKSVDSRPTPSPTPLQNVSRSTSGVTRPNVAPLQHASPSPSGLSRPNPVPLQNASPSPSGLTRSDIPCLNAHDSQLKFPTARDEGIIGPMEREEGFVIVTSKVMGASPSASQMADRTSDASKTDDQTLDSRKKLSDPFAPLAKFNGPEKEGFLYGGPMVTCLDDHDPIADGAARGDNSKRRKRKFTGFLRDWFRQGQNVLS